MFSFMPPHAGWTKRGYLPHYDAADVLQHVVFRLADSLPRAVRERIAAAPPAARIREAESALDGGTGSRVLADARLAEAVASTLLFGDGKQYRLLAWCVMPNHVHVLIAQVEGWPLARVVQGWKSITARRAHALLGTRGAFWAPDYLDRALREHEDPAGVAGYIARNPVAAGLCAEPRDWPWSSAFER